MCKVGQFWSIVGIAVEVLFFDLVKDISGPKVESLLRFLLRNFLILLSGSPLYPFNMLIDARGIKLFLVLHRGLFDVCI